MNAMCCETIGELVVTLTDAGGCRYCRRSCGILLSLLVAPKPFVAVLRFPSLLGLTLGLDGIKYGLE